VGMVSWIFSLFEHERDGMLSFEAMEKRAHIIGHVWRMRCRFCSGMQVECRVYGLPIRSHPSALLTLLTGDICHVIRGIIIFSFDSRFKITEEIEPRLTS